MHTFFTSFFNKAVKEISGHFSLVQLTFEVTVPNQIALRPENILKRDPIMPKKTLEVTKDTQKDLERIEMAFGNLCRPVETFGDLWRHVETYGDLRRSMENCGGL